jgi:hypothetical protein
MSRRDLLARRCHRFPGLPGGEGVPVAMPPADAMIDIWVG